MVLHGHLGHKEDRTRQIIAVPPDIAGKLARALGIKIGTDAEKTTVPFDEFLMRGNTNPMP